MLNKYLKTEYEGLNLGSNIANLIATMIASDEMVLRVLVEIAKRDRLLLNYSKTENTDDMVYGVTKEEIRKSIYLGERRIKSGEREGEVVKSYPAIKKIDSIIAFLMGTTIVYYERHGNKEKRYLYTMRSLEVFKILCAKGYLSKEQLFPNIIEK